ncbi:MAG: sensor histidine kinase [Acidimicrobiales bacterium]
MTWRLPRPRPTVRLRLTLTYGALFLASGALVLAITYGLVDRATRNDPVTVTLANGVTISVSVDHGEPVVEGPGGGSTSLGSGPDLATPSEEEVLALGAKQHAARMHALLVQSGIALGAMAVVSVVLGWLVAGRVLRPLRRITAATRDISATNLHERLAIAGPDDEVKELGDTIDQLLARLDAAFQSQRQFVANASHELRTPLARQRTLVQVALTDPGPTVESLRATHERVLASGAQQERLIDALLTLARGQAGLARREVVDLAAVVEHVCETLLDEAVDRQVRLDATLQPAATTGDPRLLERLVANLVDNAIRYNWRGGQLDVRTETTGRQAMLAITNTGPIVPADHLDRLFEPFDRLGASRTSRGDGLGLGLSIVRAIADAHGATVTAQARSEGGLRIEARFDATHAAAGGTSDVCLARQPELHPSRT